MFELGCHLIDAVVYLLGKPRAVHDHGRQSSPSDGLADSQLAVLEYQDVIATVRASLIEVDGFARRQLVVERPAPVTPMAQRRARHLVFLGVKGQLDPTRGQPPMRRVVGTAMLAAGLLLHRLQGRPMLWVRTATLRSRRRDAIERAMVLLLRSLAREVRLGEVPGLVDDVSERAGAATGR